MECVVAPESASGSVKLNSDPLEVGKVNYHFFHSYIGQTIIKGAVTAALIKFVVMGPEVVALLPSVGLTVPLVIGACMTVLLINVILIRKGLLFEISLIHTIMSTKWNSYHWADEISPNIILGAMSLENHADWFRRKNLTILSMLEDFESEPGLVTPFMPNESTIIPTPDFCGVSSDKMKIGVAFLKSQVDAGSKVYVHCKAGRGRSAAIVLAYMVKYGLNGQSFANYEAAYAYLKSLRPQINLNSRQAAAVKSYLEEE